MIAGKIVYGTDIDLSHINWIEEDIGIFRRKLDIIMSFLNKPINQDNFQEVLNHCYYLVDKIPLPLIPVDTNFIVRGRANYNGEVFTDQREISYNSENKDKIELNRFNRPKESMFYGAVPASDQGRLIGTISLESCKELIDDKNTTREQYFTFGKWYIRESFLVLNLCFNDRVVEVNPELKKGIEHYLNDVQKMMPSNSAKFITEYWKFFSALACKKHESDQQYFITTAFMCAVREYYKESFNGIAYPSSMTENEGVNIVLMPEAVDKYLNLKQVFMYKFSRDPNNPKYYHSGKCSQIAEVTEERFYIFGIC